MIRFGHGTEVSDAIIRKVAAERDEHPNYTAKDHEFLAKALILVNSGVDGRVCSPCYEVYVGKVCPKCGQGFT